MKIKNILVSLVAILALAAGCNQIEPDHYLDEVSLSTSYVSLSMAGGSSSVEAFTADNWTITGAPSWLTVTPTSGSAGVTSISFSAPTTLDGRSAELILTCAGKTQRINVIQGLSTVSPATCAEVIAGPDSKTYMVTGVCTGIANTNYGNWYLMDDTGEIYIYGTVNAAGNYAWSSFGIEVGDEVTVQGPKTTYNGTVELVDAQVINVNKSLIKIAEIDPMEGTFPTAGGDIAITLNNKGKGLYVEVPESAKSWLTIASIAGNTVVFHANENVAGPRSATLVFRTTDGKKDYTCETSVIQLGASGSKDLPFTVDEAIAYALSVGSETTTDFYVKGIVSKILDKGEFGSYGNASFWISDDGVNNGIAGDHKSTTEPTKDFECYSVYWFNNQPWTDADAQPAIGDEVIIKGQLTLYGTTYETASKKAWVYSHNGATE